MTEREVVDALFAMVGAGAGWNVFSGPGRAHWCKAGELRRFRFLGERLAWQGDLELSPLSWDVPSWRRPMASPVLWARIETNDAASRLDRFKPVPTVVIREGRSVRRVALWALPRPLGLDWLERGNRRIAHHLGTPKKWCLDKGQIPVPGTVLRAGRSKPVPVLVESFSGGIYDARQVVGRLKEAPDPMSWRDQVPT